MSRASEYRAANDAAAAASGQVDEPGHARRGCCHAVGCPLPAPLTDSTGGTDKWFCRCHFGAPAGDWQHITVMAKNRAELLQVAHKLTNEGPGAIAPTHLQRQIRARNRPDLNALLGNGNRTAYRLGVDLLGLLEREIRQPQSQDDLPISTVGAYASADSDLHQDEPAWS